MRLSQKTVSFIYMKKVEGGGEITFKLFGLHIFTVDGVADGVKGNSHWSWF